MDKEIRLAKLMDAICENFMKAVNSGRILTVMAISVL